MSDATPTTTTEGFWSHLYQIAASIWHRGKTVQADVAAFDAAHPEIEAGAQSLLAMAPPEVREGISIAQELASAVQAIDTQAAATGLPMTPVKPAA